MIINTNSYSSNHSDHSYDNQNGDDSNNHKNLSKIRRAVAAKTIKRVHMHAWAQAIRIFFKFADAIRDMVWVLRIKSCTRADPLVSGAHHHRRMSS